MLLLETHYESAMIRKCHDPNEGLADFHGGRVEKFLAFMSDCQGASGPLLRAGRHVCDEVAHHVFS
jgi:hypothetical protein